MFTAIFIALWVGHLAGDYFIQTDHQAQHKGLTGERSREGRWNCLKHVVTHNHTMAATVSIIFITHGVPNTWTNIAALVGVIVADAVTHYVIDRRWTLRWFAERLGKKAWIENDPQALPVMDQAAHTIIIFIGALVLAALITT